MRSRAAGRGKISPRCVPEGASDGKSAGSRQHISCMYSNTANFGKICVPCIRKAPQSVLGGTHRANILPPRGVFAVRSPQIMHGARILPPSGDPAPAQGLLPEQLHRGIAFQLPGPCPGVPAPAPRQYPPPANTCHSVHPLQPETSRRWTSAAIIRRMACSPAKPRGTADYVISTGGPTTECCAEPPAEAAGRAGPAPALPKTPIERTGPSWRNYRNTPKIATKVAFLGCPWPSSR